MLTLMMTITQEATDIAKEIIFTKEVVHVKHCRVEPEGMKTSV